MASRSMPRCRTANAELPDEDVSAVEFAVEKVRSLDEGRARQLLVWLQASETPALPAAPPERGQCWVEPAGFVCNPGPRQTGWPNCVKEIAPDGLHFLIGAFAGLRDESV